MARYHGITSQTFKDMILDTGAVYYNYVDLNNPGTLLGATKGGVSFTRKPQYADLPYEGSPAAVVGSKHLTGYEVKVTANIVTFSVENIAKAIPNSNTLNDIISEKPWDATNVHTLDNIAIIATKSRTDQVVVIEIDNPICESDFSIDLKDKSEASSKWTFTAFCAATSVDTPPWRITWPKDPVFLLLGDTSTGGLSLDGINWDSVDIGATPSTSWVSVASGKDTFFTHTPSAPYARYSQDKGETWATPTTLPANFERVLHTMYTGTEFFAIGQSNYLARSSDGDNWQMITPSWTAVWSGAPITPNKQWIEGLYVDGRAVIVSSGDLCATSTDLVNWTVAIHAGGFNAYRSTTYGQGKYVFVSPTALVYTPDGINWESSSNSVPAEVGYRRAIAYGAGVFVLGGDGANGGANGGVNGLNFVYTRKLEEGLGTVWEHCQVDGAFGTIEHVVYNGEIFVAVDHLGKTLTSSNGINWSIHTTGLPAANYTLIGYG
jgi:hypothetical protein